MKINNFIKGMAAIALIGMTTACNDDYLDLLPETNPSTTEVTATTVAARQALRGIMCSMNTQYQSTSYNQYNGELYINTMIGDTFGQDVIVGLGTTYWGVDAMKFQNFSNYNYVLVNLPWNYAYNLISQANLLISDVDNAEGSEDDIKYVKAAALTMRAYGYVKIMMYYAPRWEDSNNGNTYCAVLRLEPGNGDIPLVTMKDVMDQIYADLDEAIRLYGETETSREYKWEPDVQIAQGIYARAALIKNDWATAQKMANAARKGYNIMSNDTYLSGFYMDNDDNMWVTAEDAASIYYWSHGSHFAANGVYVQNWNLGAGAIDLDLYNSLDEKDIRRLCFITPDKAVGASTTINPGKIGLDAFWNPTLVDASKYCNLAFGPTSKADANKAGLSVWGTYNFAARYAYNYLKNTFKGSLSDINNDNFFAYYSTAAQGDVLLEKGVYAKNVVTPMGAQLKFFSYAPYGTANFPYMRASEMCLAEAEAAYHNGDEATAKKCLTEINGKRIPGYTCDKSGTDLLEEIYTCRRIELWGEGQNFTDFKRWGKSITRRAWKPNLEKDKATGTWVPIQSWNVADVSNWPSEYAITISPDAANGWRMTVPSGESDYNHAVDRSLIGF